MSLDKLITELEEWDEKIIALAKENNLDWFPITYETCDYYEMIGNMSYHGMPSHYRHWSFGKSFERTHTMYNKGMTGLPYELIINSNPSIAYLMQENPMYLQILIMCHCIGHSDFFKNNITFANTSPDHILFRFRNSKKYIDSLIEDPSIGIEKVEKILDAAHSLSLQIPRSGTRYIKQEYLREELLEEVKNGSVSHEDLERLPVCPETNILGFMADCSPTLKDWEKEIIDIVLNESYYFMPQIRTKIMNEGWASFWHFRLMNQLDLPQKYHLPFLKIHNEVLKPHVGSINPYHLGFYLFNKIEERYGLEECFLAREACNDESFLRQYLQQEDCENLNLFTYSLKKNDYLITDVSDNQGWKLVKQDLIKQVAGNNIPVMVIEEVSTGNILTLKHIHDGRDLELDFAEAVVDHICTLWGDVVKLDTIIEQEPFEI